MADFENFFRGPELFFSVAGLFDVNQFKLLRRDLLRDQLNPFAPIRLNDIPETCRNTYMMNFAFNIRIPIMGVPGRSSSAL